MKTLVISQRIDLFPDRDERRDALDQALIRFVNQAGYLAVPVPNAFVDTSALDFKEGELDFSVAISARVGKLLEAFLSHINPDGIVLSGGNDIGACLDRDLTEAILIRYAMKNEIPLLGICRGMQMLGVCMGTELREVENHVKIRHLLQGNLFHEVNSYHNYALSQVPNRFLSVATSHDGEIEAIRHESQSLHGWMWHPEREKPFNLIDIENFRKIFG